MIMHVSDVFHALLNKTYGSSLTNSDVLMEILDPEPNGKGLPTYTVSRILSNNALIKKEDYPNAYNMKLVRKHIGRIMNGNGTNYFPPIPIAHQKLIAKELYEKAQMDELLDEAEKSRLGALLDEAAKNEQDLRASSEKYVEFVSYLYKLLIRRPNTTATEKDVQDSAPPRSRAKLIMRPPVVGYSAPKQILPLRAADLQGDILMDSSGTGLDQAVLLRRIVVMGPGGQGKTTFLYEMSKAASDSKMFSHILTFQLSSLLPQDSSQTILYHNPEEEGASYLFRFLKEIFGCDFSTARQKAEKGKGKGKPVLVLMDGYNELYSSHSQTVVNHIRQEIGYISRTWENAVIIITSRPLQTDSGHNLLGYEELTDYRPVYLSGVPDDAYRQFLEQYPNLNPGIRELAHIPMYYNKLLDYLKKDSGSEGPESLYELFLRILEQACRQKASRESRARQKSFYYLLHFVVIPRIAREMCNHFTCFLTKELILTLIDELRENWDFTEGLFSDSIGRYDTFCAADREMLADSADVFLFLQKDGFLEHRSEGGYGLGSEFAHENMRDFLAAFSVCASMELLAERWKEERIARQAHINYNLSYMAAELVLEHFGMKDSGSLRDGYSEIFSRLTYQQGASVCGLIKYGAMALYLAEYLQIEQFVWKELNEIMDRMYGWIRILDRQKKNGEFRLCSDELIDILGKECEFTRRKGDYPMALDCVSFAENWLEGDDDLRRGILLNQRAKIYLYQYQDYLRDSSAQWNASDKDRLFTDAMGILEKSVFDYGYSMAANVYGMLLASPAPILVWHNKIVIDFCKAFRAYYAVWGKDNVEYGRNVAYTLRQAAGLLLKGYVKIADNGYMEGTYLLDEASVLPGDGNPLKVSGASLLLAKDLMQRLADQKLPFLNYLRISLNLLTEGAGERTWNVLNTFCGEAPLLCGIRLKYEFEGEEDFTEQYEKLAEQIRTVPSEIDRYHPVYQYIDAKNLELAYDSGRKEWFEALERTFPEDARMAVNLLSSEY